MATIKEIAKKAGVSHGTVSNVLNKKGNVSADKIRKVEMIAQELGYSLNHQASSLRKGSLNSITVIIPYNSKEKYKEFYSGMLYRAEEKEFEISVIYLKIRNNLKELLEHEVAKLPKSIVLVGLNPREEELKGLNQKSKIHIYDDKQDYSFKNVEQWFYDEQSIINEIKKQNTSHKVFVVLNIFEQNSYWMKEIQQQLSDTKIEEIYLDSSNRITAYFEIINKMHSEDTILFLAANAAEEFYDMLGWAKVEQGTYPKIITFSSNRIFHNSELKYYEFNFKRDGYNLVAEIIKDKENKQVKLPSYGFHKEISLSNSSQTTKIEIVTLKSPTSKAMEQLIPIFEKKTGIKVNITQLSYAELRNKVFSSEDGLEKYDLIRLDVAWMETIGRDILLPFDQDHRIEEINQSLKNLPKQYSHIDNVQFALPLDASMQVLFYRKDLFDNLLVKRQFYEKQKRDLEIPKNFQEFDEVSKYFSKSLNPDSPIEFGHSYVQDNPDLLLSNVLPRVNEKLKMSNNLSLDKAFESSIHEYKQTKVYSHTSDNEFWSDIAKNFANGLTAMEVLYSNYAADILTTSKNLDTHQIGYSVIPGKESLLGGGCIGINKNTNSYSENIEFLKWLYSDEITHIITSLGGVIHNKRTNENMDIINIFQWMRKLDNYFENADRLRVGNDKITYEKELEIGNEILKTLKNK